MDFLAILWIAALSILFTFFVILNPVPVIITTAILIGVPLVAHIARKNEHYDKAKRHSTKQKRQD